MRAFRSAASMALLHGITAETIAAWCKCHVTTARRWKRGEEPPQSALDIIALRSVGDLGIIDSAWAGWSLRNGELFSPGDAYSFRPGDVQAIPFRQAQLRHLQDRDKLPRQADWLSGSWEVNEIKADEAMTG